MSYIPSMSVHLHFALVMPKETQIVSSQTYGNLHGCVVNRVRCWQWSVSDRSCHNMTCNHMLKEKGKKWQIIKANSKILSRLLTLLLQRRWSTFKLRLSLHQNLEEPSGNFPNQELWILEVIMVLNSITDSQKWYYVLVYTRSVTT